MSGPARLLLAHLLALGVGCGEGASIADAGGDTSVVPDARGDGSVVVPPIRIERSLTWTDAVLLDDPSFAGLGRVLAAVAADGHGGALLDAWFRRFGTTAHSERLGAQRILEAQISAQGADPSAWDLDLFPFRVTAVHNRIDLERIDLGDGAHCGELRVSMASIDPILSPFHLIFLFRQPRPAAGSCAELALAWAELSSLDDEAFRAAARAIIEPALTSALFLAAETVEFTISPWEWRQWFLEGGVFENRPLFQTVDREGLNQSGPRRDELLRWIEANAAAIDARRIEIPERFRAESARVNDGVAWIPIDTTGLDPAVLAAFPDVRRNLEIVGCPACHATDADFVQTLPDRSFSPFYETELDARAVHLAALAEGRAAPPPFGPLQESPRLPQ